MAQAADEEDSVSERLTQRKRRKRRTKKHSPRSSVLPTRLILQYMCVHAYPVSCFNNLVHFFLLCMFMHDVYSVHICTVYICTVHTCTFLSSVCISTDSTSPSLEKLTDIGDVKDDMHMQLESPHVEPTPETTKGLYYPQLQVQVYN